MNQIVNLLMKRRQRNAQPGFSLIEVMVALIVICVGLLGIAKMQALSLSNTNNSRMRALAAIQAASLASAMHSNRQYWANAVPPNFTATLVGGVLASNDPTLTTALGATNLTACMNTQCNFSALAAFDLLRWSASMVGLLPNPTATVSCPAVAGAAGPTSCTIRIGWTENTVSINTQSNAAGGQYQTPTYLLYVEP